MKRKTVDGTPRPTLAKILSKASAEKVIENKCNTSYSTSLSSQSLENHITWIGISDTTKQITANDKIHANKENILINLSYLVKIIPLIFTHTMINITNEAIISGNEISAIIYTLSATNSPLNEKLICQESVDNANNKIAQATHDRMAYILTLIGWLDVTFFI